MYKIVASLIGCAGVTLSINGKHKPNILYIFTDQQTATAMSCAGNSDLNTPNMDRLAAEGFRFTNAYCASPLSTASRGAMFTGFMPHQTGIVKNGSPVPPEFIGRTLGHLLSQAGYKCAYGGKWHMPSNNIDPAHGFEKIHNFGDKGLAQSCISFLKQKHTKPFFLVASFDNPHNICEYARKQPLPWAVVQEPGLENCPNLPANFYPSLFEPDIIRIEQAKNFRTYPVTKYNEDDWRRYRNAYYRLVENVDKEIGRILDALFEAGLEKNTLVIFSSDHGDGNASHQWNQKSVLYEEVVNIPLIVRLPGEMGTGRVSGELVNNGPDLFASVCDWAGVTCPPNMPGKSFKSLAEGKQVNLHSFLAIQTCFDGSDIYGWVLRTSEYKYILYQLGRNREQLFNMKTDRGEMVNLAVESKNHHILQYHRNLLEDWSRQTGNQDALKAIPNAVILKP